jgi:hypothetical protein
MSKPAAPLSKAAALAKAAQATGWPDIDMEHQDSERPIRAADLRQALELAYELGRKSALRVVR